jgi:hypothetical protein
MISSVLAELAAVRETVRGLDPTFADVLAQKQDEVVAGNALIAKAVIAGFDEILERLKNGEVC